ncbi:MAG TPA: hypothetical protein VET48_14930, partial [Steroidobacteraceae bacterium]|nr:hypothetical protein [Steroidobacteraceae bacterium]
MKIQHVEGSLIFAALGAFAAVAAHAGVITNTGATLGSTDPNWSVMWRGIGPGGTSFGSEANASLVTAIPSPPWQPNVPGVNNWLGVNSNATIAGASGDGSKRYEYAFTTEINLATAQLVTGAIGYDNFFVGGFVDGSFDTLTGTYTPGTEFVTPLSLLGPGNENKAGFCRDGDGFLPSSSFPTCTVNFAFNLPTGDHKITFVIQGDGVTDAFLLNQNGVTLVEQPRYRSSRAHDIGAIRMWIAGRDRSTEVSTSRA